MVKNFFHASCSFSTALQARGGAAAAMTNCSACDKHVAAVYESAQKAKLREQHWNHSLWSEG